MPLLFLVAEGAAGVAVVIAAVAVAIVAAVAAAVVEPAGVPAGAAVEPPSRGLDWVHAARRPTPLSAVRKITGTSRVSGSSFRRRQTV